MSLTSPSYVRGVLERIGVRPSRKLGQNFLTDRNILGVLGKTAELAATDSVLEVGAGLGTLTELLLEKAGRVVAVEKDRRLFGFLSERFGNRDRLELVCGDMLEMDAGEPLAGGAAGRRGERGRIEGINKVVSNLPFSAGSRILAGLPGLRNPPGNVVVTVQREVAARLAARPGGKDYGLLGVWMQSVYEVKVVKVVSRTCFWPRPEVESAIVKMRAAAAPAIEPAERMRFLALLRHAFAHRRKQMAAILATLPASFPVQQVAPGKPARASSPVWLERAGIDARARPENLPLADWARLLCALKIRVT